MNPRKIFTEFKREQIKDLGFGVQNAERGGRFINKDGSFNVTRTGISYFRKFSIYHWLITISWTKFFGLVFVVFILVNFLFAMAYTIIGFDSIGGLNGKSSAEKFWELFFFSGQSFTTVGYGRINPVTFWASMVSGMESLCGLLFFSLIAGLLYGRFSRPTANVLFSDNALISPYFDITAFIFRVANARDNQLIDVQMQVALSRIETVEGMEVRKYYELALERKTIDFFPLSWNVVHPIDFNSPLNGVSLEDLKKSDAEFLILFKGFDDTFSQNIHCRYSYKFNEIIFGAKFNRIFMRHPDGATRLELDRMNDFNLVNEEQKSERLKA